MTNLISGKEALIALANGEDVEVQALGDMNWYAKKASVKQFYYLISIT